jgi:hypothetical protein
VFTPNDHRIHLERVVGFVKHRHHGLPNQGFIPVTRLGRAWQRPAPSSQNQECDAKRAANPVAKTELHPHGSPPEKINEIGRQPLCGGLVALSIQ